MVRPECLSAGVGDGTVGDDLAGPGVAGFFTGVTGAVGAALGDGADSLSSGTGVTGVTDGVGAGAVYMQGAWVLGGGCSNGPDSSGAG